MKKLLKISVFLLLGLGLSDCSKDQDEGNTYVEDHRFFLQGKINGKDLNLKAGESHYYLETSYKLEDQVLESRGMLAPYGNTKQNSLEIIFRGPKLLGSESEFDADSNMTEGPVPFRDASNYRVEAGQYYLKFNLDGSTNVSNPKWTFADGSTSYQNSPGVQVNSFVHPVYPVSLGFNGAGCKSSLTHHINLYDNCDASFSVGTLINNTGLRITPEVDDSLLHHTNWYINGDEIALETGGQHLMALTDTSVHIKAVFTFKNGCEKTVERTFYPGLHNCQPEFSVTRNPVRVYDHYQLGTVELIYYDDNGTAYSSHYQNVNGSFMLLAVTPYQNNDAGQHTSRFFFETHVYLRSDAGAQLHLENAFGSLAIAHP